MERHYSGLVIEIPITHRKGSKEGHIPLAMNPVPPGVVEIRPTGELQGIESARVAINKGFFLGTYPVTRAQWAALFESPPGMGHGCDGPGFQEWLTCGTSYAIDWVDHDEALEFCRRLSGATGRRFCLPLEVEWEHACRAGTPDDFPLGDPAERPGAYFRLGQGLSGYLEPDWGGRSWIGAPNRWGFQLMQGFLLEWCADGIDCGDRGECFVLRGSSRNSGGYGPYDHWSAGHRALGWGKKFMSKAGGAGFRVKLDEEPGVGKGP
jgi:formylglycine-generating enzyme required for sulfatase activity